jgi:DDE superfamily endonuclease/Tc5 transposase DNA-binding domain
MADSQWPKPTKKSQRLSKEEEKVLIQYFQDLQRQDLCPNYPRIRRMISEILQNRGDHKTLGKHYVTRFLQRHPELKTGKTRAMDVKRLTALDPTIIERFFSEFERLRSEYSVEIDDIYNMDETGFQLSQTTANFVVYDPALGRPIAPAPEGNHQWATIIECVGINRAIKPYLIFIGKALEDHMFLKTEELPDIIWAFSPKGWIDNELAVDWLRRVFVPKTSKQGRHSILILDNHNSHIIGEFQYCCLKHDIHPLYLPTHASHKLQPLDVGPFSPLSAAYGRSVQNYTPTGFATLDRVVFTKLYTQARQMTLTERNIRAGWKRAGIWPLNKQKLLDNPAIKNFGRTMPEYQPPPVKEVSNHLLATPKKENELRELISTIAAKVTPRTRRNVRKLGHAAIQEHTGAQILRTELRDIRKQAIEQELRKRSKRLRKEAVQRSWDLEQVRAAREGRAPSRVRITHRSEDSLRIVILSHKLE